MKSKLRRALGFVELSFMDKKIQNRTTACVHTCDSKGWVSDLILRIWSSIYMHSAGFHLRQKSCLAAAAAKQHMGNGFDQTFVQLRV